jgi:two-component system nitrate/nitrite response regulator NarL
MKLSGPLRFSRFSVARKEGLTTETAVLVIKITTEVTRSNYEDSDCADDNRERNYDSPHSIAEALPEIEDNRAPSLSARQKFILNCLIEGDLNRTTAKKVISLRPLSTFTLGRFLRKICVQNRTRAAIRTMNNGSSIYLKENGS